MKGQKFLMGLQLKLPLAHSNLHTTEAHLRVTCAEPPHEPDHLVSTGPQASADVHLPAGSWTLGSLVNEQDVL